MGAKAGLPCDQSDRAMSFGVCARAVPPLASSTASERARAELVRMLCDIAGCSKSWPGLAGAQDLCLSIAQRYLESLGRKVPKFGRMFLGA